MQYQTILYEKQDGMGIVTLNRPEKLNAFNAQLAVEMNQLIDEIAGDDEVRVVIFTGNGKAFCVGADLQDSLAGKIVPGRGLFINRLELLEKPVIAAVNGRALGGGCELALVCDLRIASTLAEFGVPEIKVGVLPGAGGTQRLPRIVGVAKAKELIYTGDSIDADEAYRIGVVNKVVAPESLMAEARKLAAVLMQRPPLALRMAKSCVDVGMQMDLTSALEYEARVVNILLASEDCHEGMKAFLEKRAPVFKGR